MHGIYSEQHKQRFYIIMFVHSVGKDEHAHMRSLAIASTAALYKMIEY